MEDDDLLDDADLSKIVMSKVRSVPAARHIGKETVNKFLKR
jgi:hypothetical protein